MLEAKPRQPTITTSLGFVTSGHQSVQSTSSNRDVRTRPLHEPPDRLERDRQAQREEEHPVHEGGDDLRAPPAERKAVVARARGQADGVQRDEQAQHVVQHVERVRDERERADAEACVFSLSVRV
jgi:hypothetical protein